MRTRNYTAQRHGRSAPTAWMSALLCLCVLLPGGARADVDALLERVPAGSVAVFTWEGFTDDDEAFAGSKLKAMLDDTDLIGRWTPLFEAIGEKAAQEGGGEAEQTWAKLSATLPALWRSSAVAYFGGVDFTDARDVVGGPNVMPSVSFGVLIETDEAADDLRELFAQIADEMSGDSDLKETLVTVVDEGGVIGLRGTKPDAPDAEPITGDDRYTGAFVDGDTTRHVSLFLDGPALLDTVRNAVAFDNGEEDLEEFDHYIGGFGLDGLGRLAWASGFIDTEWQSTVLLEAPAPRRGFVKLLEQGQLDGDILTRTTRGAPWARAFRLDALHSYDTVLETLHGVLDEHDLNEMDDGLASINDAAGFDVRDDLLAHLGADWLVYTDPGFGGLYGTGVAVVQDGIRDADALNERLLQLMQRFNDEGQNNGMPFQWTTMELGDVTVHSLPIPLFSPSWAMVDGRWVFANSPQSVMAAAQATNDDARGIEDGDTFAAVTPHLQPNDPADARTSVMVVDTKKTAVTIYQNVNMGLAMVGREVERELGVNLIEAIPPLNQMSPHLGPAGSVSWLDDAGYHSRSRMPFPFAASLSPELMVGGGGPSVAALGVGIMSPALGAARNSAREMAGLSNVRQILLGLMIYAEDNDGRFPATLDQVAEYMGGEDGVVFHHPQDPTGPDRPSFLLILPGAVVNEIEAANTTIAVVDREDFNHDGRVTVGYADGHAQIQAVREVNEALKEQTGRDLEAWASPALMVN